MIEIADIEVKLVNYLLSKLPDIQSDNIIIKQFGVDTPDKAILIRREGSAEKYIYEALDRPRIFVVCRDNTPEKAKELTIRTIKILDNITNTYFDDVKCFYSELETGPDWLDDPDSKLNQMSMYFNFIIQ